MGTGHTDGWGSSWKELFRSSQLGLRQSSPALADNLETSFPYLCHPCAEACLICCVENGTEQ